LGRMPWICWVTRSRDSKHTSIDFICPPYDPCPPQYDPHLWVSNGESVILVRTNSKTLRTEAEFRERWGACLLPTLQVRLYGTPGFSSGGGDAVRLYDPDGRLVDRVDFGRARIGVSFVYDTNSWVFGAYSTLDAAEPARRTKLMTSDPPAWPAARCP